MAGTLQLLRIARSLRFPRIHVFGHWDLPQAPAAAAAKVKKYLKNIMHPSWGSFAATTHTSISNNLEAKC
jgi:hypothetical protein